MKKLVYYLLTFTVSTTFLWAGFRLEDEESLFSLWDEELEIMLEDDEMGSGVTGCDVDEAIIVEDVGVASESEEVVSESDDEVSLCDVAKDVVLGCGLRGDDEMAGVDVLLIGLPEEKT